MRSSLVFATFSLWMTYAAAAAPAATSQQDIDKLFAAWNQKGTPGAVLAVAWDGMAIHRSTWAADLKLNVPARAEYVFARDASNPAMPVLTVTDKR